MLGKRDRVTVFEAISKQNRNVSQCLNIQLLTTGIFVLKTKSVVKIIKFSGIFILLFLRLFVVFVVEKKGVGRRNDVIGHVTGKRTFCLWFHYITPI